MHLVVFVRPSVCALTVEQLTGIISNIDTHGNNICAQKLNRNRTFFNRCTFWWTLAFKVVRNLGKLDPDKDSMLWCLTKTP